MNSQYNSVKYLDNDWKRLVGFIIPLYSLWISFTHLTRIRCFPRFLLVHIVVMMSSMILIQSCDFLAGSPSNSDIEKALKNSSRGTAIWLSRGITSGNVEKFHVINIIQIGKKTNKGWPVKVDIKATCIVRDIFNASKKVRKPCERTGQILVSKDSFGEWMAFRGL